MLPEMRTRVARLHVCYSAAPAEIAQALGFSTPAVEAVFSDDGFIDAVRIVEEQLIQHVQTKLGSMDLPLQAVRNLFEAGTHHQKVSLARQIAIRYLSPNERWPNTTNIKHEEAEHDTKR